MRLRSLFTFECYLIGVNAAQEKNGAQMRPVHPGSARPNPLIIIGRVVIAILLALPLVIIAGVFSAQTACAHDPRFACSPREAARPIVVSDPAKSWAFYGRLAERQEDHYSIQARAGTRVPVSILLDVRDAANPARPVASVYDGGGTIVERFALTNPTRFYEPFSRVYYLSSGERQITLAEGRSTVVIVMSGGSQPQRYAFAIGRNERFSPLELPYLAGALYRIHTRKF